MGCRGYIISTGRVHVTLRRSYTVTVMERLQKQVKIPKAAFRFVPLANG